MCLLLPISASSHSYKPFDLYRLFNIRPFKSSSCCQRPVVQILSVWFNVVLCSGLALTQTWSVIKYAYVFVYVCRTSNLLRRPPEHSMLHQPHIPPPALSDPTHVHCFMHTHTHVISSSGVLWKLRPWTCIAPPLPASCSNPQPPSYPPSLQLPCMQAFPWQHCRAGACLATKRLSLFGYWGDEVVRPQTKDAMLLLFWCWECWGSAGTLSLCFLLPELKHSLFSQ